MFFSSRIVLNLFGFKNFGFELSWWRLFQKRELSWWRLFQKRELSWWRLFQKRELSWWRLFQKRELSWWRLFQKRVVCTKLYLRFYYYVTFIFQILVSATYFMVIARYWHSVDLQHTQLQKYSVAKNMDRQSTYGVCMYNCIHFTVYTIENIHLEYTQ